MKTGYRIPIIVSLVLTVRWFFVKFFKFNGQCRLEFHAWACMALNGSLHLRGFLYVRRIGEPERLYSR